MNVWHRLTEVTALRFVALSARNNGWNGSGSGTVVTSQSSERVLVFTESGCWAPDKGQQLKFSNVYRWSLAESGDRLRLEHLRFGEDSPVHLVDLARESEESWTSVEPHVCGEDIYSARLRFSLAAIDLHWIIKGPKKDEDIQYRYSAGGVVR